MYRYVAEISVPNALELSFLLLLSLFRLGPVILLVISGVVASYYQHTTTVYASDLHVTVPFANQKSI